MERQHYWTFTKWPVWTPVSDTGYLHMYLRHKESSQLLIHSSNAHANWGQARTEARNKDVNPGLPASWQETSYVTSQVLVWCGSADRKWDWDFRYSNVVSKCSHHQLPLLVWWEVFCLFQIKTEPGFCQMLLFYIYLCCWIIFFKSHWYDRLCSLYLRFGQLK